MLIVKPSYSRHPTYKVIGLVLILPLMISLMRLGGTGVLLALATSAYGAWFAVRYASTRLKVTAVLVTLLNLLATVLLSTPSVLMALGYIAWLYAYPALSEWLYWQR
ncbi:hypothetical protein LVW35_06885 [Pseudomonas sp. HN11]|uniref:hypothetical protein n=1 Tax=Pseudomonas sp. HN11 TaxID=1344094 RepID=UPI001F30F8AA|nr:hypothetical protein [Pseudomonas sp. HN11]UII72898.1 hypothetical protein LVW35_06885 [Pseudomonas sp. HN11]